MGTGKLALESGEAAVGGGKVDEQVGMRGVLTGPDFIGHAPVTHGFEGAEDFPDFFMGPAVLLGVIESQLPLSGRCVSFSHR